MKFFPTRTTFLQIGSLTVQWYAIFIVCGALLAYYFTKKNLKDYRNIDTNDFFDNFFVTTLWCGIIGARLWYCVFNNFSYYFSNPLNIIRIWDGGLAFHGGFVFGVLGAFLICKKNNVSFIKVSDSLVPTVLLAQAVGRWGNFVNKECHGVLVDESYFDGILFFLKDGMYIDGNYYVPLFFYESVLCFVGFILINFVLRKTSTKRGELSGAYLIWYGVVRFFIESGRTDSLFIGSLKTAQVTSIIFVIFGLLLYFGFYDKLFYKKPTIVFDLDGTLQDSTPSIIEAYKKTFEKYGNVDDFTIDRQVEVLGPPIADMFKKYFPDENNEELCAYYREINAEELRKTLVLMPNALEVLKTLKDDGYRLAILTTRMRKSVLDCLSICGLKEDLFDVLICYDDVQRTKPDPEGLFLITNKYKLNGDDLIMVGDSVADVLAGKSYGAYTIAYLSNDLKKKEVLEKEPNRSIDDLKEILDIVKEKHYFTYNLR